MTDASSVPDDAPANVFVLVGDCLRAADCTPETTPFLRSFADCSVERCYAPSTWTLPSHASLYSRSSPIEHGVTRRGQRLSPSQARLPRAARDAGYRTALFSENPTFSGRYGFENGIDFVDDFVNSKLFPADYAPENEVEGASARDVVAAIGAALRTPGRLRNLVNGAYAPVSYALARRNTGYPHHGDRVLSHLNAYLSGVDEPSFAIVNLLDTHNPHHAPPEPGAAALEVSVPEPERAALAAASDNKQYLFEEREMPPSDARDRFGTWEAVFKRRRDVYRTQVRYLDHLLERWIAGLDEDVRRNSLFVVTGDHGQLFGVEGMVGHNTSLHPRGIEVPLYCSFPEKWDGSTAVDGPAGWLGLADVLADVVTGDVSGQEEFASALRRESTENGSIVVTCDGPTWNVQRLRGTYGDATVEDVTVKKVGFVEGERQVVYECSWDDDRITRREYELIDDDRVQTGETHEAAPDRRYRDWLRGEHSGHSDPEVSARLRQLGYL